MIIDMSYWTRVLKNILYVILILIGLFLAFKLAIFYMPFLVAFIISLIIEPAIRLFMKKAKMTRKASSIIIFIVVSIIILGVIVWGIISLFSEASNLLQSLNYYMDKIYMLFQSFTTRFNFDKIHLPDEIIGVLQNSTGGVLNAASNWIRNSLTGIISIITSIPTIVVYIVITIMALYLICVDKVYILDQIEHHFPKKWVAKMGKHIRELINTLGGYLKAEATLILVSFIISLIGLSILKLANFNIEFPLLMALFIGFVDALPILGSGTVMVPWAIISALNGDLKLGVAIIILLIIMSTIRQFLEPRLVSKHIGTHPIFTLIAMYTGFKFIGVLGMLVGPIILIIIKNVFATLIDEGVVKSLFDKK
ncbi:sporulation integral membrane protein YtvI [Clostridium sp. CAG:575]|nr:sporulation integral membrane protein YtvI [Clostridium sp. CAG:575]